MALNIANERLRNLRVDWRDLLPLAGGTALLLLGLFCAWQTWLIADEGNAVRRVHLAQDEAVRALAAEIASQRGAVEKVLASVDPATLMSDPAQSAAALRRQLPQAKKLELYSGELTEVLKANYREFGYAKAAQLMAAQSAEGLPLAQSVSYGNGDRRLSLVIPLGPPQRAQAWAWVELPFAPLRQRFDAISPAGGRLDLRQGDDRGYVQLLSHGTRSAEAEATGKPVAGSVFSVGAGLPGAFIVLPRWWLLSGLLALLGLGGGGYLLRLRQRWKALPEVEEPEVPLPARQTAPARAKPPEPPERPAAAPVAGVDPSIFRAYDVRGVVGKTLNKEVARALGQSIGTLMVEKGLREIVVGRDGRLSGPELAAALADGLREAGVDVIDIGAVPTPVVYYATYRFNTGCGVAVTGSHNPPDYNGFKIVVGGQTLAEGAIQDLYQRIAGGALASGGGGGLRQVDVAPDYIEKIIADVLAERRLKVVVDCGNGIPGAIAPQVLEGVGCEVVPLYCDVDGSFPNHHPDPSDPHNLEDLILAVRQTGADLGLAFDGDGDRLGVVTRSGEIVYPDRLLMLFARDVLSRQPGATVIYDVKCTSHLKGQILDAGGSPLMWRTGHSLIKAKMRETQAELAGEMSGHFFFKERWYGFDDGIYAAARLLEILAGDLQGRSAEQIFATLPKSVSTPELKVELAEGEHYRFMDQLRQQASFEDASLITIDGVRADWPDGWGLVRASNTTPVLVLRFEADDPVALKRIQQLFRRQLLAVNPGLKLPF
ncbi:MULTISPECIES: phosphomannomutase/phosphoglucomutase [Rhodanobacter]|uniref:phosphomannomutase/phosphoglucomutase n=1 Tax=Rhodanobacter TaxID=75309 RepID=UPI0004077E5E|nr:MULTISPECIES: phosphomannomutase/phosphoglucomutase [Rhodanobacter]UJJ51012.1 phosphomannomutase/phosphoglucomutase [Rhodanobacter denitrificans]UJJ60195.1 phosphomannomutase/phosphoglucomutase [Rhodanobacter denitrificans]UJM93725.1 phosphomannomutase/phosphoglucomutase [Rhodanobacter denitrificans]UJM97256.1 phosphomannomutase/phosphoglucomutase [Rhodanobacter denitrificans]UJN19916.1 phosphomannomutase/phosphoglucomutase [Rhodanobacter denitrificans]